jgi:DNA-sulfur modification-associated
LTIENSKNLEGNVNRVTDRLTGKNPQVVTLSTLREMMRSLAPHEQLDESELQGMARVAGEFYDLLVEVRPELGHQSANARKAIREALIVDSATMMHGYAALMKDFNDELGTLGTSKARSVWRGKLEKLSNTARYTFNGWNGDLFDKRNPLWRTVGVVKPGRDGVRLTVLNTGAARLECGRVLRQLLAVDESENSLAFLAKR